MSKQVKVLVFHAHDSIEDAYKINKVLQKNGFQSITLDEFRSTQKDLPLGEFYNLAINSHDHILCLISDGLFANCNMKFPIGLAFGQNKVISAMSPNAKVIIPTWYKFALKNLDKNLSQVIFAIQPSGE